MNHIIDFKEVNIQWEQISMEENHGSGCTEWYVEGIDDDGNEYGAIGEYQDDELINILDIEKL